jgi:hypothetical protein
MLTDLKLRSQVDTLCKYRPEGFVRATDFSTRAFGTLSLRALWRGLVLSEDEVSTGCLKAF